jgi:hypothetical protein
VIIDNQKPHIAIIAWPPSATQAYLRRLSVAHDLSGKFLTFWGLGMRSTEARQNVRMIKFLSILNRCEAVESGRMEAAELFGAGARGLGQPCATAAETSLKSVV